MHSSFSLLIPNASKHALHERPQGTPRYTYLEPFPWRLHTHSSNRFSTCSVPWASVSGLHYSLTPPPPFNFSGVLSSSHNLQIFFHPIFRHFLNVAFNSTRSFAARRSFWAAFKSSIDAIAGMTTNLPHSAKCIAYPNRQA